MAPDLRSTLRSIDENLEFDKMKDAISIGISAIKEFDEEREFEYSISVLEKLIAVYTGKQQNLEAAKCLDQIISRLLLIREDYKIDEYRSKYSNLPKTAMYTLMECITDGDKDGRRKLVLENIDKQSIFGDFKPVDIIPYIEFEKPEEALDIIQDFYKEGRFVINLQDKTTSLHQSLNLDLGHVEEVNIVEREHVYKIK